MDSAHEIAEVNVVRMQFQVRLTVVKCGRQAMGFETDLQEQGQRALLWIATLDRGRQVLLGPDRVSELGYHRSTVVQLFGGDPAEWIARAGATARGCSVLLRRCTAAAA